MELMGFLEYSKLRLPAKSGGSPPLTPTSSHRDSNIGNNLAQRYLTQYAPQWLAPAALLRVPSLGGPSHLLDAHTQPHPRPQYPQPRLKPRPKPRPSSPLAHPYCTSRNQRSDTTLQTPMLALLHSPTAASLASSACVSPAPFPALRNGEHPVTATTKQPSKRSRRPATLLTNF